MMTRLAAAATARLLVVVLLASCTAAPGADQIYPRPSGSPAISRPVWSGPLDSAPPRVASADAPITIPYGDGSRAICSGWPGLTPFQCANWVDQVHRDLVTSDTGPVTVSLVFAGQGACWSALASVTFADGHSAWRRYGPCHP